MFFDNGDQYAVANPNPQPRCDLMFFDNGDQSLLPPARLAQCCDLMFFDNGDQSRDTGDNSAKVVI